MPLLEASSISKSYSGVRALKRVSFDLLPVKSTPWSGENGAGKSTLIKIVTGAVAPDSGTLRIAGRVVEHHNPTQAHALGIAVVYQQPALFPDLTVAENIALGLESGGLWRRIDWKARARAAREALARAGAEIHPDARVSTLSMPEQQIVEIAKAIGAPAKILILDEPTASLTDREVERLFQVIATVRAEGAGIVYISHRLEEVAAIADRVTVLRDGETIATCDAKGLSRAELIRMMVGREIEAIFPKRAVPIGEVALEVRNLKLARRRHPRRIARSPRRRNSRTLGIGRLRPHPIGRNHLRTHSRRERRDPPARPHRSNYLARRSHPSQDRLRARRPPPARRGDVHAHLRQHQPGQFARGLRP
jgi:rhamnose transport system ATP-binding protein